jgi:uncharacterized protein YfaA (DUF2138 family)
MNKTIWSVRIGGETYAVFINEREAVRYAAGEWGTEWRKYVVIERTTVYSSYDNWIANN